MQAPTASLTLQKQLPCSPAYAFRAWTVPELFQQWFIPQSGVQATATMDLRPGGRYEIRFHRQTTPAPLVVRGEFLVVDPPRYLEYTWKWAWDETPTTINHSVVKVTFTELAANRTEISLTHEGFADPEDVPSHTQGWTSILACMAQALAAGPGGS